MTADDFEALGGVYKTKEYLGQDKMKIALGKTTIPGKTNALRLVKNGSFAGDIIVRQDEECLRYGKTVRSLKSFRLNNSEHRAKEFEAGIEAYPLLKEVVKGGKVICDDIHYGIERLRQTADSKLSMLGSEYKRLKNPHLYGVGQETRIERQQQQLIKNYQAQTGR